MKKIIWIDLDNSPHVPFFRPIIAELEKLGIEVFITTRDYSQVNELANRFDMQYNCIGRHHGKNKILKLLGLYLRALQLIHTVVKEKPTLALSHGSRSQLIAARLCSLPSIVIRDYEFAKKIPLMSATAMMIPEVIPNSSIKNTKAQIFKYPGIKEDVYVPFFNPDHSIIQEIGLNSNKIIITIRPPADVAHYHNPISEKLFDALIDFLAPISDTQLVILPRYSVQADRIARKWLMYCNNGKIIFPKHVVDGLNLLWHSDLVVSGGGTMNREAAALSVPVYSIFRGKIGSVDRYLAENSRLTLIENIEDIKTKIALKRWDRPSHPPKTNSATLNKIVRDITSFM